MPKENRELPYCLARALCDAIHPILLLIVLLILLSIGPVRGLLTKTLASLLVRLLSLLLLVCYPSVTSAQVSFEDSLTLAQPGFSQLTVLSPSVLELMLVTTKRPYPARIGQWNFVDDKGEVHVPDVSEFAVKAGEKMLSVGTVGFKRRVLYAPFKKRDLRIANYLYLQLASPLHTNDEVKVTNPSHKLWPDSTVFSAVAVPDRLSPAIHVNQTGYAPAAPKRAMVGYFLGNLGELEISRSDPARTNLESQIIEAASAKQVFTGMLTPRPDHGFDSYQRVFEADFTQLKSPGQYRLAVPGLGASFPFHINEGVAGAFARTYALGIYHQRCGTNNDLPFTRFIHGPCHLAPA